MTATPAPADHQPARNATVGGGDLPLGPDDVVDYLSQYGVVTVDHRGMYQFSCWLSAVPLTVEPTKNHSYFEANDRLYAYLERGNSRWAFEVRSTKHTFGRYWGHDLCLAVDCYREMSRDT